MAEPTSIEHPESPTYEIHPADLVALFAEARTDHGISVTCDSAATKAEGAPRFLVHQYGEPVLLGAPADEVIDYLQDEVGREAVA